MKQLSPESSPGNLRVFLVCLLSFATLMAPFAAIAAPRSVSNPTVEKATSEKAKPGNSTRSSLEDLFVNPPAETAAMAPAAVMPKPAPQPLPLPPAVGLTASMVASFPAGGDVDGDLKADPGDKIKYTVTLDNTTGAVDALGLNFTDTIDLHTTYPAAGGTVNSTPVAFDLSVSTPEDPVGGVSITISGQDPDGNNLTFLNSATGLPFGATTTLSHGTLGAFSAPDCATTPGICKTTVSYTPTVDYNGSDGFGFRVNDGIANSNEPAAVSITVTAVNDAPTFTLPGAGQPPASNEDAGAQTVTSFITNVKPGPVSDTNENGQTVSFVITNNTNPSLFLAGAGPVITVAGAAYPKTANLTYTADANKNGTAVITYHAHDTGGTSPGVDNSADQTFTITVNPVNDKPVYSGPQKTLTVNSQMKTTGNTGLLAGITDPDAGDTGFSPQTIVIDPATIDLTNCKVIRGAVTTFCTITVTDVNTGTFDFDPPAGAGNGAAISFSYKAKDNGNPAPGILSDPITVNVTVNGPPIWFVNLGAAVNGDGRLSAPFNSLASANTELQTLGTNNRIFLYTTTATTQAAVGAVVQLNATQWLIGQGTVNASGFDSFMGITPPANTIARPSINSATRTTVRGKVTMIGATQVQGVNIDVSAGATQGLAGSTPGSVLTVKDVNVTSAGGNAVDFNNAGTITYTNSSASSVNVLTSTTGIALNIVGGTTIGAGGLNFQTINVTGNGSSPSSGIVLNNTGATAGLTVTGNSSGLCGGDVNTGTNPFTITAPATADCTGGQIQGTGGPGISLTNTRNVSLTRMWIHNTFRSGINGTTVTNFTFANGLIEKSGVDNSLNGVDLTPAAANVANIGFDSISAGVNNLSGTVSITDSTLRNAWYHGINIYNESGTITNLTVGGPSGAGNSISSSTLTTQSKGSGVRVQANGSAAGAATVTKALIQGNSVQNFPSDSGMKIQGGNAGGATQSVMGTPGSATDLISITGNAVGGPNSATPLGSNGIETAMTGQGKAKFSITSNGTSTTPIQHFKGIGITCSGGNFSQLVCIINNNFIDGGDNIFSSRGLVAGAQIAPGGTGTVSASITSNTVNNSAGQGIYFAITNSNITGNAIIKNNTVGAPRDTDTPAMRVESGSSSGNTNLCLDMASNTATGSTGGGLGPAPGGGVRRQGNVAGVNTFGIVGLSPSPATAVQTESYLSTQNPGSSLGSASFSNSGSPTRVYVIGSGGPTFVSCSSFTVAALKREADDTLAAVRNESGTPQNSQPGYLADASDIFQNDGTGSLSSLNAGYDFARIFEPINHYSSTTPAALMALNSRPTWLGAEAAISGASDTSSLSQGLISAARGLAQFVASVDSLVVPTASAESVAGNRIVNLHDVSISAAFDNGVRKAATAPASRSIGSSALHAGIEPHLTTVQTPLTAARSNHVAPVDRAVGTQSRLALTANSSAVRPNASHRGIELNHAEAWRAVETKSSASVASMFTPAPPSGETITVNGVGSGFKLPIGRTVTITFIVTMNAPPALSGVPPATPKISNQGTISSSNLSGFLTDDPSVGGTADPTNTPVDLYDSTTAVTSSPNPSNTSAPVTFTATIGTSGTPDGAAFNRTGTVVFKDGGAPIACSGGNQNVSSNQATCITSALATGNHTITAEYSGDGSFDPSAGALNTNPQVVGQSGTTVTLYSSLNPATVTQTITFTATVTTATSVNNPTGTVTFRDAGVAITCTGGSQTLNGSGVATCQISTLSAGDHTITADYGGDTNFSVNNGTVMTAFGGQAGNPQVVALATPTVTLGSSLNPSRVTQNVTFTATVAAPAGVTGTPQGTLTFRDGGIAIGCSNAGGQILNGSGVGTCQVATLPAGTHVITADYVGDASPNGTAKFNNASGTLSPDQVVNKSDTTTTLSDSPAGSSAPAGPVVFTATVASQTAVTGPPAGKVQFLDGGTPITCTGVGESGGSTGETLAGGSANCTTSTLTVAVHSITAQYTPAASPDPNGVDTFNGSTASALSHTVGTPCSNPFVVTSSLNSGPNTLREGIDTKVCDGGTITFSGVSLITLATPLSITRPMTITGPGAGILTVSGNNLTRIFDVSSAQPVTISGMTMNGGRSLGATGAPGSGGGILNSGNLTLSNVTLSGNQATGGAGAAGAAGGDAYGGAIMNSGTLALNNSTVNGGNSATGGKGGDSNTANGNGGSAFGGGIYNTGTLTLNNTTVASNGSSGGVAGSGSGTAGLAGSGSGGGIYNDAVASPDVMTIFNSTISGNSASTNGGGIANVGLLNYASLAIINSTISGNMASNDGGGLYNDSVTGATALIDATVTNNHADQDSSLAGTGGGIRVISGPVTLKDTIVAANFSASLQVETATVTGGPITGGVKQVETLTVVVTSPPITTGGTGKVRVTISGTTLPDYTISLVNGDTAASIAIKIRDTLNADTAITNFYAASVGTGGNTADVILTANSAAANDGTLNMAIIGCGTAPCTGLNSVPTSANTATGVPGSAGTKQVETMTVLNGPVTACPGGTTGTVTVLVIANGMTGSGTPFTVAVNENDTAATVGDTVRNFINGVGNGAMADNVKAFFDVTGSGATIIFTAKQEAADDGTMTMSVTNGTCSGINSRSDNTTAGVAFFAGLKQIETLTVGTPAITGDGNATIQVTVNTVGPTNYSVAVTTGQDAAAVALAIKNKLNTITDITNSYVVTQGDPPDDDKVILTAITEAQGNDASLKISIVGCDTCTGSIPAADSANTQVGQAPAGTNQVETLVVLSGPSGCGGASGTVLLKVIADTLTGSGTSYPVTVNQSDSAATVGDTIRTFLTGGGAPDVSPGFFAISGSGANVIFTKNAQQVNDTTMTVSVLNGSCTVVTASSNTIAGVAPVTAVKQVETATVSITSSPISTNGTGIARITAAGVNGGAAKDIPFTVAAGDNEAAVAVKIKAVLDGDAEVFSLFDVTTSGADVILTRKIATTNDTNLNLAIIGCGASCPGLNSVTTSANTTLGVAPGTGNAKVTITADPSYFYAGGIPPGTKTVFVPVVAGDTAAQVAAKARDVLNADTDVNTVFMATAENEKVRLTRKVIAPNDTLLSISIDNDTSTGLSPSPASEDTRLGGGSAIPDDISGNVDNSAASSFNLIGNGGAGGLTAVFGNQVGVADPKLGPLANNGGPTFTHQLNPTSPALEAGITSALTTLASPVADNVTTTVNVANGANIPVGVTILVDTEQMLVTARAVNALTVTRGANGTTAATHSTGANVFPAFDQRGFLRTVNSDGAAPLAVGSDDTDIGAYELQAPAAAPNAPTLDPSSDTGTLGDNITADTSPTFNITGVVSGANVELLRDDDGVGGNPPAVVVSGIAVGSTIQLTDPSVGSGTHSYTARQTVSGSAPSASSGATQITIDTTTPATPDTPDLINTSDTGSSDIDNLTNALSPVFSIGNVTTGFTVDLLRDGGVVASGTAGGSTIPLTDTNAPAGPHTYTSRQSNGVTTTTQVTGLAVIIDRTAPATPGTPDLQTGSDSGSSSTDNLTNATSRLFDVAFTAEANSTVALLRNGSPVTGATAGGDSSPKTLTDSEVIADNGYSYSVRHTDAAGNASTSSTLAVTFDSTSVANTPDLQTASDSFGASTNGTNSDNLTKTSPRSFDITGTESGALVELLRGGVPVPGASATSVGGTVTLTDSTVLADGPYVYQTRQTDTAGNVGLSVPGLTVNIDTTSNAPGTPDLKTTSDAGTSSTDDRTDNATHSFDIASLTGAFVELLRDGTPVSSGTATGASITLTDGALPDGLYHYTARQTDPAGNGPAASGGTLDVTIDATAPIVSSVVRANPNPTSALTVDFTVTFAEDVTGVDAADFAATGSGGQSDASVFSVTPVTASQYTVKVTTGSGDGSLRLDVIGNGTIKDLMNLVFSANFTSGEVYTVSKSDPAVSSVTRADTSPTNASSVNFNVTFNKAVTGVNIGANSDFALTNTGTIAGASITGLSGSGTSYTVTVNTGAGSGTIRLDVVDDDTIVDSGNRPIGGAGAGNGDFTTGSPYDIDKTAPTILSVVKAAGQADPAIGPTSSTVINFTVTFDEAINSSSFIASDVNLSGSAGATVANVSGSGTTYNVSVQGMVQGGAVTITIPINAVTDPTGNANSNSGTATVQYLKDDFTALEVNTIADHVDDGCDALGTGGGNQDCTLREAIKAANDDFGADTITFASALNPGGAAAIITLLTALPDITTDMTIQGPGAKLMTVKRSTAGGTPRFRIFFTNSAAVIISGLTINNGFTADGANNVGGTGAAGVAGGGILNSGTLTLTNVAVNGNQSGAGGNGMFGGPGGSGGGISNTGTLTLTGSTINGNQTGHGGDGNAPPPPNGAGGQGAGIFNTGTLRINNSTITGNQTGAGGSNGSTGNGGGIYTDIGTLTLINGTITLNAAGATGNGGGIYVNSGTVILRNTIVGANTAAAGLDINGTVQSDGFNLIQSNSGATINPSPGAGPDIIGNSLLNPLADNGGPTSTHSLNCTSPAIDKGTASLTTLAGAIDNVQTSINVTSASFIPAGVGFVILIDSEQMVVTGKVANTLTVTRGANTTTAAAHANLASVLPPNASDQRGGTRPFDLADSVYVNAAGGDGSDIGAYETQSGGGCLPEAIAPSPLSTTEDTGVEVNLRGEYSQNTNLVFTIAAPAHGSLGAITDLTCQFTLKMICTAKVIYTPAADYNGVDSFKFKAVTNPGGLESQEADVNITITSVNDPPLANSDPLSDIGEDSGPRTIPFADLLANDSPGPADEAGQTLTIFAVGSAVGGTASIQGTDVVFTPAANFNGVASFKYTARDNGTSNGAADPKNSVLQSTVTFNVTPTPDTPSVTNATTNEDTQTTSGLVVSRNAGDGAEVTNFKITGITNGTLFQTDGTTPINNGDFITIAQGATGLKFTPAANLFSPTSTFSFQAQASLNNTDAGLGGGLATATITVNAIADTPSVTNASTSVNTQTTSGLVISRNAADSTEVTNFKITNIQNGTLFKNNGTTQINNGDFITAAEGNAGLKFTPATNLLSPGTTFSFDVQASTSNADAGLGGSVVTATISVTCGGSLVVNSNDSGAGSLRAILLTACPGTTITFDMTPGHVTSPINLASELLINKNVTIQGPGANLLTIAGNNTSRLINVNSAGVNLTVDGLSITGGGAQAGASGSAIEFSNAGTLTLANSEFFANSGAGIGVVSVTQSTGFTINSSTFRGNTATSVAKSDRTPMTVVNSTFSGNTGTAIYNSAAGSTVTNSTIAANSVGIQSDSVTCGGCAANVTVTNTLLSNNGNFSLRKTGTATITSGGRNLLDDGTATAFTAADPTNIIVAAGGALIGLLANNGGPTQTHALLAGSPALDAGDNAAVVNPPFSGAAPFNDQRGPGFLRIRDAADVNTAQTVDIGAFEADPSIEDISDKATTENSPVSFIFNLGDAATAFDSITASSSNTTLLPNANILISGSGSSRTMTLTPAANTSGTTTVTVTVTKTLGGAPRSMSDTFLLGVNDGGTLQFSSGTYSVVENAGPGAVTITRTGGTAGTATVQVATSNGTAVAGTDYTAVTQTVTFNDGETSKVVTVPIIDNLNNQPSRTINVTLSNVGGSGQLGAPITAVLTILDDDPTGGYIRFSAPTYSVGEGAGAATITVERLGTLTQQVSVDYATSDDSNPPSQIPCAPTPGNTTATSRCDFNTAIGRITFGAGDGAAKTFTVLINQDTYLEGPENLPLTLSNLTGGATFASPSTATLTITDDDLVAPTGNTIDDPASFVRQHYRDFLNREADAAGLAFWTNQITSCGADAQCIEVKRVNVSAAFFLSIEFQVTGGTAYLANKVAYGGLPNYVRFETDAQALGRNYVFGAPGAEGILEANKVAYFNEYVTRTEFTDTYNGESDQSYVNTLISNTGVAFTQLERDALINGLANHTETRATVLRKITEKPSFRQAEFNSMFVLMEYFGYLHRNPDNAGFNFWLNKLNQFNGNFIQADMVKAFINSAEYRQRFGP